MIYKKRKIRNVGGSWGYRVYKNKEIILNGVPGWVAETVAKLLNQETQNKESGIS